METGQVRNDFIRRRKNITIRVNSAQKTELQYIIESLVSFESMDIPINVDVYTSKGLLLFKANDVQSGKWRIKIPFLKRIFQC